MKTLITAVVTGLMMTATLSQANPNHHHGHRHYGHHSGYGWVAPLAIGSALGYVIATRPAPVTVQTTPSPVLYPNQYPQPPLGYHYEQILDATCNCYRIVLVQN